MRERREREVCGVTKLAFTAIFVEEVTRDAMAKSSDSKTASATVLLAHQVFISGLVGTEWAVHFVARCPCSAICKQRYDGKTFPGERQVGPAAVAIELRFAAKTA